MYQACPQGTFAYRICTGDSLWSIADKFQVSMPEILAVNPGFDPNFLYLNQTINIPALGSPIPTPYQSADSFESLEEVTVNQGPPTTPPPGFTPSLPQQPGLLRVDPGALAPCRFRFSYIWLVNGQSFWAFLVFVGRTSVAGWRFLRGRWVYFGVDLRQIQYFICY